MACDHGGENEYRKRVLYLMAEAGHRPITGQEKRIMVQNFAHFQQWCFPGSRGNYFADSKAVPRAEAACVVCAQKDYLEHRHTDSYFLEPSQMKPYIRMLITLTIQTPMQTQGLVLLSLAESLRSTRW